MDESIDRVATRARLASALGKMGLILETRSKANLHNRNTLFILSSFEARLDSSIRLSTPVFFASHGMHLGGGSREGFVKDFRLVDSGIERRFRNERFDRTVRMKREKGYLEILFSEG